MLLTDSHDIFVKYPDTKNACTESQLEVLAASRLSYESFDVFAAKWLAAGCTIGTFEKLVATFSPEELADNAHRIANAFLENHDPLTRQPYGVLYLKNKVTLTGPADHLAGIGFGQFVEAEQQYFLFHISENEKHLRALAATLYRTPFEHKFNAATTPTIIKSIADSLTLVQCHVIYNFYSGCRSFLTARFPNVFPSPSVSSSEAAGVPVESPKSGGQSQKPSFVQVKTMYEGYHAKMVQYAGTPDRKKDMYHEAALTVLEFIEADIINYNEEKAAIEKSQRNAR